MDLLAQRLLNQHIAGAPLEKAEDAVRWLGAVQSQDYPGAKWSLGQRIKNATDAKIGCELNKHRLTSDVINGQTFWFSARAPVRRKEAPLTTHLIPEYDEALIGSKDLGVTDLPRAKGSKTWNDVWCRPVIVAGMRAGTWRRTIAKGSVIIETNLFASLNKSQIAALKTAVDRYGEFLQLPARLAKEPR